MQIGEQDASGSLKQKNQTMELQAVIMQLGFMIRWEIKKNLGIIQEIFFFAGRALQISFQSAKLFQVLWTLNSSNKFWQSYSHIQKHKALFSYSFSPIQWSWSFLFRPHSLWDFRRIFHFATNRDPGRLPLHQRHFYCLVTDGAGNGIAHQLPSQLHNLHLQNRTGV